MRTVGLLVAGALFVGAACGNPTPTAATSSAAPSQAASSASASSATSASARATASGAPLTVTVLVTSDENGQLERRSEATQGGAAELAAQWRDSEHHCVAPAGAQGQDACKSSRTLALSTGDHWTGPALSSFVSGASTAEVMRMLGYAASGLGNHELDFGFAAYEKNRAADGMAYLGANVLGDNAKRLSLEPFRVFERGGVRIAVVALADPSGASTTMPGRFDGIRFEPYEDALARVLPEVERAGADAVVLLLDDCPERLEPKLTALAGKVSAVVGGHCSVPYEQTSGKVPMLFPGKRFESYGRVELAFDPAQPAGKRLLRARATVVPVKGAAPDPEVRAVVERWKKETDKALGEEIGFSKSGMAEGSEVLGRLATQGLRETLGTDVAVLNKKGLRHEIPAGPISKATIYGVVPFENSVMIASLTGAQIEALLDNPAAIVGGAARKGKELVDAKGKPLDRAKKYRVATLDYLYFGRDGFELEKQDPDAAETGMMVQTVLIHFTKAKASSRTKPLEAMLD